MSASNFQVFFRGGEDPVIIEADYISTSETNDWVSFMRRVDTGTPTGGSSFRHQVTAMVPEGTVLYILELIPEPV